MTIQPSAGSQRACHFCSKPLIGEDAYYFHCKYCDHDFCSEHRLPESHLCVSNPVRRSVPSNSSMPYYTTGGGYYSSTGRSSNRGGFTINISHMGRNLAILIAAGLVLGFIFSLIPFDGVTLVVFLVQYNALVYTGWYLPILTSIIIVYPGSSGLLDVFFNAIAVVWLDRLLSSTYSPRQYYSIFALTGVGGNLLSLLYGPDVISFGASGGIFGLIAGAVMADYALNRKINGTLIAWFVFIFVISGYSGGVSGGVDLLAHLGGAVVGLPAGYIVGRSRRNARFG
ncbi:MAG: rhomboid family intramembrane serine protease [Nitrososphaerales archaeon]